MTGKFVSQIENGHVNPSVDAMIRLIEHGLGIPTSAFFAGVDGDDVRDDLIKLEALVAGQPPIIRRRVLRTIQAWRLQAWLGHKRIDETMLYVHVAEAHHRELPEIVREKARGIDDPDQRVLAMLGARGSLELNEVRGSGVAVSSTSTSESSTKSAA